ncbi:hypothetical protein ACWKW9_11215 [Rhizobium daejeonense]
MPKLPTFQQDQDNYLNALRSMIESAKDQLSPEMYELLSVPSVLYLTDDYWEAPVRIMIMGQETHGVERKLSEAEYGSNSFQDFWTREVDDYARFDFGAAYPRSAFWRGFQEVADAFKLPSKRSLAWSNICKCQLLKAVKDRFSIQMLSEAQRREILIWQKELFLAEIRYARPDAIMMFTGGLSWMAARLFSYAHYDEKTEVMWGRIGDLPDSSGYLIAPRLAEMGIPAAYTNHPAARGEETKARRDIVVDWLKAQVAEKLAANRA